MPSAILSYLFLSLILLVTVPLASPFEVLPRKGGGAGGGHGGGGGGGHGGGAGRSGSTGSGGASSSKGSTGFSGTSSKGFGGGTPKLIGDGTPFAGRYSGGGTRDQVYGTRYYGSGYYFYGGSSSPTCNGNCNFPFGYWPLSWGCPENSTLYNNSLSICSQEYGKPDNQSRPGGPQVHAYFTDLSDNTTVRLLGDNDTVNSLLNDIWSACAPLRYSSSQSNPPRPYTGIQLGSYPLPEQVIQYYRFSSLALTLDNYNDTDFLANRTDSPVYASTVNGSFISCVNETTGRNTLIISSAIETKLISLMSIAVSLLAYYLLLHCLCLL